MKYLFRTRCSYFHCIATDTDTQILFIHTASTFYQEIPALYLLGWLPLFIHITYHAVLFCRDLNPRRPEAAPYRILHRAYIRPCATIKRNLASFNNFSCKRTRQWWCNSFSSVFGQYVNSNLPSNVCMNIYKYNCWLFPLIHPTQMRQCCCHMKSDHNRTAAPDICVHHCSSQI